LKRIFPKNLFAGANWRLDIETGTVSQQITKGVARKKAKDS
jgi:hypothetical protein